MQAAEQEEPTTRNNKIDDTKHLLRSIELANESVKRGNHPFGVRIEVLDEVVPAFCCFGFYPTASHLILLVSLGLRTHVQ